MDVSVLLPLRDAEAMVGPLVHTAQAVHQQLCARHVGPHGELALEILALDERSGDNTSSVLSVLHGQLPQLRTLQDLERGSALRCAARLARGDIWLVIDHPVEPELAAWAIGQVINGQRAAIVPGEILALHRTVGVDVLRELDGGLAVAQREVARHLRRLGQRPAFSRAADATRIDRALLFLRGQSARVGLGFLDRPVVAVLRQRASILRNRLL
ncbi:MAG: hypothetical protein IAG13_13120 [Deltaproteobacteria bacterium]|nr:hypothetical protein [Nannocystaceae bacterium]